MARPSLSILIPFYNDDPSALLEALLGQSTKGVEICLYDDGTNDSAVNAKLQALKSNATDGAVTLLLGNENQGRSAARNALFEAARAPWVLFLDADMMPTDEKFVTRYIEAITKDSHDIIFGGFAMSRETPSKDTRLHHAFSMTSDCLSAKERTAHGPQYVCSSNLAVRKSVLTAQPFDTGFTGWGWEDSEWAARVGKAYRLSHLENPALHLGLESTQTLLSRFKNSAANYDHFTRRHPRLAQTLTLYKMMNALAKIPGQGLMRPVLRAIVSLNMMPMRARLLALKLWRASWYASYRAPQTPPTHGPRTERRSA